MKPRKTKAVARKRPASLPALAQSFIKRQGEADDESMRQAKGHNGVDEKKLEKMWDQIAHIKKRMAKRKSATVPSWTFIGPSLCACARVPHRRTAWLFRSSRTRPAFSKG